MISFNKEGYEQFLVLFVVNGNHYYLVCESFLECFLILFDGFEECQDISRILIIDFFFAEGWHYSCFCVSQSADEAAVAHV